MPRLTIIWHGAIHAEYRRPFQILHEGEWEVSLIAPRSWSLVLPAGTRYESAPGETFTVHLLDTGMTWHAAVFTYRKLWRTLRATNPDVVFAYEEPYSLIAYRIARWCRARRIPLVVQTCQDIYKTYPIPFRWTERAVLRYASVMLGLNRECLDVLRRKGYEGPAHVAPSGVDVERYANAEPSPRILEAAESPNTYWIGYTGRLAHEKGVDLVMKALSGLPPRCRLAVAGDGPHAGALRALARGLGIADRVLWLGTVAHKDLPCIYAALDVLVLASRTQSNWQEQFGRVLIEAMAAGVPVVAARCGAIPDVVGDAGILVDEENHAGIRDGILSLLENEDMRSRLAEAGWNRIGKMYTQEYVASLYAKAFQEALAGGLPGEREL